MRLIYFPVKNDENVVDKLFYVTHTQSVVDFIGLEKTKIFKWSLNLVEIFVHNCATSKRYYLHSPFV